MKKKMLQLAQGLGRVFNLKRGNKGLRKDLARSGKLGSKLIIMQATTTLI